MLLCTSCQRRAFCPYIGIIGTSLLDACKCKEQPLQYFGGNTLLFSISECSPGSSTGGSERSNHASSLPRERSKTGSCFGSRRLSGRRTPALGMPKLWGRHCPAFARSFTRSCAARRRASPPTPAPSQYRWYWAHRGEKRLLDRDRQPEKQSTGLSEWGQCHKDTGETAARAVSC